MTASPALEIGKKVINEAGDTVNRLNKFEKVIKLARAILNPFKTLGYLPDLPPFLDNFDRLAGTCTDLTGGVKIFPRLQDWISGQNRTTLEVVQLTALTASQMLSTAKLVCKLAEVVLPAPVLIAKDSLQLSSFSLLAVKHGQEFYKFHKKEKKVAAKVEKWQGTITDEIFAKKKGKYQATTKEDLRTLKLRKWENVSKAKKESRFSLIFDITMIALLALTLVATLTLMTNPFFLTAFATVGLAAAILGAIKAFKKKE